ncbi:GNAT family N-acetyltransferase [Nocardioides sp.]|uniref:GNAT family N-acetyltransferase n=1 Tax=Nocardioides sp. TaxID=35761 RepID=UPI00356A2CA0
MAGLWPQRGLSDGLVLLRTWRLDDAPARLALSADPDVRRWSPPMAPATLERVQERIQAARQPDALLAPRDWVIADPEDDAKVLGSIDLRIDLPPMFRIADLGYNVLPWARGRGVASAALRLLSQWLLASDGKDLQRLQLDHAVENQASCRTALRAGFRIEGQRASFLPIPDGDGVRFADVCMHGLAPHAHRDG